MSKHDNPSNSFSAKFDVVHAADRFVESIEDRDHRWNDIEKGIGPDDNLFEAFGQIDLWDDSVDAWTSKFDIDPDDDDDEDYEDEDFDYEDDDDDWDYEDDDDFDYEDDDEDFDDDDD